MSECLRNFVAILAVRCTCASTQLIECVSEKIVLDCYVGTSALIFFSRGASALFYIILHVE